ncbi:hypothetical protein CRG98_023109 [Punica granatum]|uniref:Uncharacterized protein n=1 Tax=Punica granatum TaxID=22663 RepID=A0A2I0JJM3_PUNGR|nr:hypothetical protein CRG98_023109 [Punica granatum]
MVTLFHDMMHKEVEVYVDNMIAKSKEGEDHLVNLKCLFDCLKEYNLRLNPAKCTFGARSGKLLGFVVNERGIEVDPDKVKAIKELPPPLTVRENAFDTIKAYLIQLPVLVPPMPNHPLILYLTVRRQSLGCMLGQEDRSTRTERAIYYLSKKFTEGESNYPEIEKMCCALVWVMQRFRQYTLYHTIRLLSKADPLRYLLDNPSSMRNIAKWRCQLTEYDIEYVSCTSVKGQAIADHLAEFPINDDTPINADFPDEGILQVDEEKDEPTWKMYFDGAVNSMGSGVGAVLISPDGRHYPTLGQWKTKDAKLVPYHEYLEELAKSFEKISFTYTPSAKNQFADALATLASMASIAKGNIIEPLEIEVAKGPAYCYAIKATDAKPWYEDIKDFLQTAITLASVTVIAVARFLKRDVIARYGVPATIITDNAKNLNNKVLHVAPDSRGKFSYRYDGPFVVKEIFFGGAIILSDMDGAENALPVNVDAIKKSNRESQRMLPADGLISASRDRSCSRCAGNRRGMHHTVKPPTSKEGQAMGDHYQSPRVMRPRPKAKRTISHGAFGSIPV